MAMTKEELEKEYDYEKMKKIERKGRTGMEDRMNLLGNYIYGVVYTFKLSKN